MAPGLLQKAVALGVCLFGTVSIEDFGVSGALVTTSTKSATLTALNQNSEIASVSLIPNGNDNRISTVNDFRCTQNNYDTFCVKLDIFNTGCQGIETLELTVYGGQVGTNTNVDLYSLFSMLGSDGKVDFLSYLSDWSGGVNIVNGGINGGVFEAPACGSNTLMKYDDNNDIIGTIWDRMGTSTSARVSRKIPVNQNLDNWNHLTSEGIGVGTSPIKFTLINDLISNTLTTTFEADTITPVTCTYNTAFDTKTGNNYAIGFQTDQGTVKLSQFDIKTTCQEPEPACDSTPMDIFFSMDSSLSVTEANWPLMKDFVTDLISNEIDINSHIAVNDFAKGAWMDWQFTDTQNPRTQMINAIDNIAFPTINGNTWTRSAILQVIDEYRTNGRSLNDADRLLVLMTDGKPYPADTESPCDLKDELDALNIKVLLLGIGNDWILKGGRDLMKCMVDDVTTDMIHIDDFSQAAFDKVKERVSQAVCPKCDYTHICKAVGDPHITTWDGTLYHFQGNGYFDYLTGCTYNDKKHLPITISALQVPWLNSAATIVNQVVVSLSDGFDPYALQIIFPNSGTNPTFRNGVSAIGKHLFFNGKYETTISNGKFEVLFYLNDGSGRRGKIKFNYSGYTLIIETSDCLSEYLCGLCGQLNNNPTDDFKKCDTFEIIDDSGTSAYWQLASTQKAVVVNNMNEFGESCCNKDLDNEYLGTSDCTVTNPIIDECIDTDISYNLCLKAWNNFCNNCKDTSPSEEWLINCAYDMCLDTTCKEKIQNELNGGNTFTFLQAQNLGCLKTTKSECEVNCPVIKPPARTLCDDIYDSVLNSNIDAVPFYQWWNNKIGNHFYTHNAAFDGIASNYVSEGISGYIWKGAINGGFTVPFYRFKTNDNGIIDHFYTDNGNGIDSVDENDHKHTISLYEYEGIAGYIMKTHCSDFNQPLYRYWSDLYNDHFYTTEYRDNYPGYIFENVAGYVAREAM